MESYWKLIEKCKKQPVYVKNEKHPNTSILCKGVEEMLNNKLIIDAGEIVYNKKVGSFMIKTFLHQYLHDCKG